VFSPLLPDFTPPLPSLSTLALVVLHASHSHSSLLPLPTHSPIFRRPAATRPLLLLYSRRCLSSGVSSLLATPARHLHRHLSTFIDLHCPLLTFSSTRTLDTPTHCLLQQPHCYAYSVVDSIDVSAPSQTLHRALS
jgi:hypothetical protein